MPVIEEEIVLIYVFPCLQRAVLYAEEGDYMLLKDLKLHGGVIKIQSVLVQHEYVQHERIRRILCSVL